MLRIFRDEIGDPLKFTVTLELVPGTQSRGRRIDSVMQMARAAYEDGRISAVSITDNPGGNPALSPDAIGREIFSLGMDVIVHVTCRDQNRIGMESRALQLDRMGMKNILALNGDYAVGGFGGQGAPVFDLDSVSLLCMLNVLNDRISADGDPEEFFTGCAVSPFKQTEAECFAQYFKLCKKVAAGAAFIITQLGYDARKYQELLQVQQLLNIDVPTLGSVYVLTPRSAEIMRTGQVPGAVVTQPLLRRVRSEWHDRAAGRRAAVERAARLGAVLKGLGYRGIHIEGVHHNFETVARILDRLEEIQNRWQDFLADFDYPQPEGFYVFQPAADRNLSSSERTPLQSEASNPDRALFRFLKATHDLFFDLESSAQPFYASICRRLDRTRFGHRLMHLTEDPAKRLLLSCIKCGDCGIQHVGFLCPETQCPKHIRNGACGGSRNGMCEVYPDRPCVWVRAYKRWATTGETGKMLHGCVPPRMWELNNTSSWLNFHLKRDHQSASNEIARQCSLINCAVPEESSS